MICWLSTNALLVVNSLAVAGKLELMLPWFPRLAMTSSFHQHHIEIWQFIPEDLRACFGTLLCVGIASAQPCTSCPYLQSWLCSSNLRTADHNWLLSIKWTQTDIIGLRTWTTPTAKKYKLSNIAKHYILKHVQCTRHVLCLEWLDILYVLWSPALRKFLPTPPALQPDVQGD